MIVVNGVTTHMYIYIYIWLYTWAPGIITLSTVLESEKTHCRRSSRIGGPAGNDRNSLLSRLFYFTYLGHLQPIYRDYMGL